MIGIDCGGSKIHIVRLDQRGEPMMSTSYVAKRGTPHRDALKGAYHWLNIYKPHLDEDRILMEAPVLAGVRNIQSTIKVAQMTGLVIGMLTDVRQVAVSTWKKDTIGKGNASKDEVKTWLTETHPRIVNLCGASQDYVDAACIALSGLGGRWEVS